MKSVAELKNAHKGEDVFVLGSGPSMDFYLEGFFDNRLCVGVNHVYKYIPCQYSVFKEAMDPTDDTTLIVSEYARGWTKEKNKVGDYVFKHRSVASGLKPIDFDDETFLVSRSTLTSALHFAAHIGARAVFVAGHDCGMIDGREVMTGYHDEYRGCWQGNLEEYAAWLKSLPEQTHVIERWLRNEYGCQFVTMDPIAL